MCVICMHEDDWNLFEWSCLCVKCIYEDYWNLLEWSNGDRVRVLSSYTERSSHHDCDLHQPTHLT